MSVRFSARSSAVITGWELKRKSLKSGQVWHDNRWIQMATKQMSVNSTKVGQHTVLHLKVESNVLRHVAWLVGSVREAWYLFLKGAQALHKDAFVPKTCISVG